jgi:hypothetical protein
MVKGAQPVAEEIVRNGGSATPVTVDVSPVVAPACWFREAQGPFGGSLQHLRQAVGEIGEALLARDIRGLNDQAAWDEAMDNIDRTVQLARATTPLAELTDEDRAWLEGFVDTPRSTLIVSVAVAQS